jgi:hypothetical protein
MFKSWSYNDGAAIKLAVEVLGRHSSVELAAKEIGALTGHSTMATKLRRAFQNNGLGPPSDYLMSARKGYAPGYGWNPPLARTEAAGTMPPGFELERRSELIDGDTGDSKAAWLKSRQERAEAPEPPPDFIVSKVSQFTDGQGKLIGQWKAFSPEKIEQLATLRAAVDDLCKPLLGGAKPAKPPKKTEETLTVYGLGDPHIGMLSWAPETTENFDLQIAEDATNSVVERLIAAAPPSRIGGLALIGDNFHADDDRQLTPGHGHKLDVDGRAPKVWRVGCRLWRTQIDRMLKKHAEVMVWVICGNHDPLTSFFLREWIAAWYRDEPRVKIGDNVPEHQYYLFGKCLLGFTHGHRNKPEALAGVMAADVPELWAKATAERHWITGHIHSKTFHELRGCTVETLRTLAAKDSYAARNGYRSKRASVAITYDPEHGEILRATVGLR